MLVFFSLYGEPPAPGRLLAWPGVPISPGRVCTVATWSTHQANFHEKALFVKLTWRLLCGCSLLRSWQADPPFGWAF